MHLTQLLAKTLASEQPAQGTHSKKHEKFKRKSEISGFPFSSQKTLYLFKKGLSIKEIAEARNVRSQPFGST
jgi:uncharacterized protein YpbB